jgi:hypothetical protein
MKTGNDSSIAKDLSDQKKVITTNDFALVAISRHKIQAWRVAIWLHFGSRGRRMCFPGDKGFNMSTLHQSQQSKATRLLDSPQPINLVLFLDNARKETSKRCIPVTDAIVIALDSPISSARVKLACLTWTRAVPILADSFQHDEISCITDLIGDTQQCQK